MPSSAPIKQPPHHASVLTFPTCPTWLLVQLPAPHLHSRYLELHDLLDVNSSIAYALAHYGVLWGNWLLQFTQKLSGTAPCSITSTTYHGMRSRRSIEMKRVDWSCPPRCAQLKTRPMALHQLLQYEMAAPDTTT